VAFLKLSSPFPSENLEIMIDTDISTTYKNRYETKEDLIDRITNCFTNRMGNFMVFFPSFEYMNMIMPEVARKFELLTETEGIPYKVICQFPDMSNEDKTEFLSSFSERFAGVLLGACVLGGNFGEGIDLVGDRLSGVIIVGTGMPKITPERQILANYYSDKLGDGFAFAYRFPGWQKVLQAVGRVIRTEEDTGFALLIDDRLDKPEYISLYPEHWKI
jgi:DNA excision repair protein ERCC-2